MTLETTRATAAPSDDGAATVLRPDPLAAYGIPPGTLLVNTYRVERLLGGGGMGEVYLARHTGLGTEHAIKVIRPSMASNGQVMELFYREAKVLRGVRHDAVVSYDGFVRDDQGRDYLVMEYVEGPSLSDRMKTGPLSPADVLTLRDRLCAGLAEAHRRGAVHRDLSPDNVILPGDRIDSAKLIDFGLCKLTTPGQETIVGSSFAGKYRYASPEQFGMYGGAVDARSDIYSLGLILAAAAQGRPVDMGESFEAAFRSRQQVPDLSAVPLALREWLGAMLQPDPASRPASVDALLDRWPAATVLAGKVPPPTPVEAGGSKAEGAGGRPWLIPGLGLLVLGGAGLGIWWMLRPLPPPQVPGSPGGSGEPAVRSDLPQGGTAGTRTGPPGPNGGTGPGGDTLDGLLAAGRLDDAFSLAQAQIASGQAPPAVQTWALAERLRETGKADSAFALIRTLAAASYGPAAFALAELYDPNRWTESGSPFSRPNAEKALEWYRRAEDLGVPGAKARLDALLGAGEGR